jgi:hypothetical protein
MSVVPSRLKERTSRSCISAPILRLSPICWPRPSHISDKKAQNRDIFVEKKEKKFKKTLAIMEEL